MLFLLNVSRRRLTTRVPLVLRLTCDASIDAPYAEIGKHADLSGAERVALDGVAEAIERLTAEQLEGCQASVKDAPVHLRIVQKSGPSSACASSSCSKL